MPETLTRADSRNNEQKYALSWRWRERRIDGVGIARNADNGGVSRGSRFSLLVFPDYTMSIAFCAIANTEEFFEFGVLYESLFREFALAALAN